MVVFPLDVFPPVIYPTTTCHWHLSNGIFSNPVVFSTSTVKGIFFQLDVFQTL
jgi:hypothetical protein